MKYAVNIIGYGKKKRFVPVKVVNGLVIPIGRAYKTQEDAMIELEKNGFTCSTVGDIYSII